MINIHALILNFNKFQFYSKIIMLQKNITMQRIVLNITLSFKFKY